jgi:hypothetical protein
MGRTEVASEEGFGCSRSPFAVEDGVVLEHLESLDTHAVKIPREDVRSRKGETSGRGEFEWGV